MEEAGPKMFEKGKNNNYFSLLLHIFQLQNTVVSFIYITIYELDLCCMNHVLELTGGFLLYYHVILKSLFFVISKAPFMPCILALLESGSVK